MWVQSAIARETPLSSGRGPTSAELVAMRSLRCADRVARAPAPARPRARAGAGAGAVAGARGARGRVRCGCGYVSSSILWVTDRKRNPTVNGPGPRSARERGRAAGGAADAGGKGAGRGRGSRRRGGGRRVAAGDGRGRSTRARGGRAREADGPREGRPARDGARTSVRGVPRVFGSGTALGFRRSRRRAARARIGRSSRPHPRGRPTGSAPGHTGTPRNRARP
jgi:hypothetical protein